MIKRSPAMGQFSAESGQATPTIVGGQPRKQHKQSVRIPAGLERVLYLAATDQVFHDELLQHRGKAVEQLGLSLTSSERAMLEAAPEAQLRSSIDGLDVSPENLQRRRFMQAVAVGATAALAGCGDGDTDAPGPGPETTGILADIPPSYDSAGMLADMQPPPQDGGVGDVEVPGPDSAGSRPGDGS